MIFTPGTSPLKKLYPTLKECEEFKSLTDREMLFVYWYSCKSSPLYSLKGRAKMHKVAAECKDYFGSLKESDVDDIFSMKFPSHISEAMKKMESFNPEMRQRASTLTDKILSDFELVVMQDIEPSLIADDNAAGLKSLIDIRINIAKNLPAIVEASENGFGTKARESKTDKKSLGAFEDID